MSKQLKEYFLRKPEEEKAHLSVGLVFLHQKTRFKTGCLLWITRGTGHLTWDTLPAATMKYVGPKGGIVLVGLLGCRIKLLFPFTYLLKSHYLRL